MPAIGHVGISSLIIVAIYAIAMRTVFRYERKQLAEYREEAVERYPKTSLRQAVTGYSLAALVVVATGTFLPFVGVDLAQVMGWKETFVGTLFIAFATSVPEIVVTIAAVRLDALDMAVGNLFGSNLFDILIVAIDDVVFVPGPILADVSTLHVVSSLSAVMMTGVAVVSLLYRPKTRVLRTVGWGALLLFSFYLLNSYVLFLYGG
jgi:cation:H+ antiporter